MSNNSIVYITAKDLEEARKIGRSLVENKLAACINIFPKIENIYKWKGKITEDTEVALIAKTRKDRIDPLIKHVKSIHSYETPCIVSFDITAGNKDFLDWINDEVQ